MVQIVTLESCRVCLQNADSKVSLFTRCVDDNQIYNDKLTLCSAIKAFEGDGLPPEICDKCAYDLRCTYEFVTKCRLSDGYLRSVFLNNELNEVSPCVDLQDDFKNEIKTEISHSQSSDEECPDSDPLNFVTDDADCDNAPLKIKRRKKQISASFICPECGVGTVSQSAMAIHLRKHTRETPFKCSQCERAFAAKGILKRHLETFHCRRERKFICEVCGNGFYRKSDIKVHMRRHTGELPYACSLCPRRFLQISTLIRHKRTHTGAKPFPCGVCGKFFADRSMVKKHLAVHSDDRKHGCSFCGKALKTRDALKHHITIHKNENMHVCDHCGIAFSSKGYLKRHIMFVHSSRSGFCPECRKHFSDLQTHVRKHTGEKPFSCDLCKGNFMSKKTLLHHARYKHANANKYKCSVVGCGKTFPVKYYFNLHKLKYHSNETPYICPHCGRGFCRISDLTRHLKMSHGNEGNNSSGLSCKKSQAK